MYTDEELRDCHRRPRELAARFAAKEAAFKALGADEVSAPWRLVSVRRGSGGIDSLKLTGAVQALAEGRGVTSLRLSLSHQSRCAVAVVLAGFNDD